MSVNKHYGAYRPAMKPLEINGLEELPPLQHIPALPEPFGREEELDRVQQLLDRNRVAVITGMAGSGKTALMAAASRATALPLLWIDMHPSFNNNMKALLWQLAQPLAQLSPRVWKTLHRFEQARWEYPPLVVLQAIIAAYAQLEDIVMFCIDSIEHVTDQDLKYMIVTLCEYVALTQNSNLRIIVAGRSCPYKLKGYAINEALSGLSKTALRQWASHIGLNFADETIDRLHLQTGGLPEAIARFFQVAVNDHSVSSVKSLTGLHAIRHFLSEVISSLTPEQHTILINLSTNSDVMTQVPFNIMLDLKRLEDQHIAIPCSATAVTVHPIFRQFYRQPHV